MNFENITLNDDETYAKMAMNKARLLSDLAAANAKLQSLLKRTRDAAGKQLPAGAELVVAPDKPTPPTPPEPEELNAARREISRLESAIRLQESAMQTEKRTASRRLSARLAPAYAAIVRKIIDAGSALTAACGEEIAFRSQYEGHAGIDLVADAAPIGVAPGIFGPNESSLTGLLVRARQMHAMQAKLPPAAPVSAPVSKAAPRKAVTV